ncbi:energy transducer TonB [Vibrio metoecus]|uniref:Protein TonB n=1 Tax=Vibrio metoecus TaxID=1481663 RepID=A0A0Q0VKM7_VIBMT|nr:MULTISPECIES: energy transducer TonB [Vibrio]EEX65651.1 ferric siderophore transport system binding protein TonB [Vibrio metoecus]KQA28102.1 energy transducer TonB [Vibrio metoecus]KQB03305.1 energy transducer TonB [Vibrio metoecus]MDP4492942.1 energy transducer TonB [Vibrio sp. AH4]PAR52985.1 energy transducer TonB [Vibrio metoecus]
MGRLILACPMALAVTLALFSLMAWMVDNGGRSIPKPTAALSFTMVMAEQEQDVQRRQRSVPEQPQVPQVPTQAPARSEQTAAMDVSSLNPLVDLNLSTAIEGVAVNAPQFGEFSVNQQVMPLHRVEPNYPAKALQRGVEGYVTLRFNIDELGKTRDIEVVDANPKRYFEREAMLALRNWKYQPKMVDGKAVVQTGLTVRLEFKLQK